MLLKAFHTCRFAAIGRTGKLFSPRFIRGLFQRTELTVCHRDINTGRATLSTVAFLFYCVYSSSSCIVFFLCHLLISFLLERSYERRRIPPPFDETTAVWGYCLPA